MPRHIICVDGAPSFLALLRELLEEEHYQVTTAAFAPYVYEQIVREHPDLVLLDLGVGTSEGWDLLAQLEEGAATVDLPVMVLSTDAGQLAAARSATSTGHMRAFRAKPFDIDDLIADVVRLIGPA